MVMKMAGIIYTFVTGRLLFFSLVLSNQEQKFFRKLRSDILRMSQHHRDGPVGVFLRMSLQMFKGDIIGVQYGLKYYTVAAIMMTTSDVIFAYSRFVDQTDRSFYVLIVYYIASAVTAMSSLTEQACLTCLTRVLIQDKQMADELGVSSSKPVKK